MSLPTLRIPRAVRQRLLSWAHSNHIDTREPEFTIGSGADPFLRRWYVIRENQRWLGLDPDRRHRVLQENQRADTDRKLCTNIYVHQIIRSDDDRALHDHPWPWMTIILSGSYIECLPLRPSEPAGEVVGHRREPGDCVVRLRAERPHRLVLLGDAPVITLFVTGPKLREWGFWCENGWRHWRVFTATDESGNSRGCE